jgi:hypothetical protein
MSEKISQMSSGNPAQAADQIPIARPSSPGSVLNVTAASIAALASPSSVTLKTNGVTNSSQTLLDLTAGANITLSNVAGVTTIAASGGGGSSVLTAVVSLSSADLIGLRSTPKTLVAGQAGKTIVPVFYQLVYTFVTAPYTGVTGNVFNVFPGTDINLQYDNGIRASGFVDQSSDLISFSSTSAPNNQSTFPTPVALASFQGQPLSLGFGNLQGAAPLSGGSGTMVCTVVYMVI